MASQCCATGAVLVPGAGSYANLALANGYALQAFGRCAISSNRPDFASHTAKAVVPGRTVGDTEVTSAQVRLWYGPAKR